MFSHLKIHPFGLPEEKKTSWTLLRASVAIHASIMLWVGCWDLIAVEKRRSHISDDDALFRSSLLTYVIYTLFGSALCIATDTLYGNAGLMAGFLHPRYSSMPAYVLRLAIAWCGTMLMWAGLYNVIDLHVFPADVRANYRVPIDFSLFFGGIVVMVLTDSFYWVCYLAPEGEEDVYTPTFTNSLSDHVRCSVRTLLSVLGQTMVALGTYDFMENNSGMMGPMTVYRELTYYLLGALLLVWTDAWVPLSWMDLPEDSDQASAGLGAHTVAEQRGDLESLGDKSQATDSLSGTDPSLRGRGPDAKPAPVYTQLFDLRCFLALTGQMIHNTAVWTFLDLQIFPGEPIRHAIYIVIGAAGLLWTGTLGTNFGMDVLPLDGAAPDSPPRVRALSATVSHKIGPHMQWKRGSVPSTGLVGSEDQDGSGDGDSHREREPLLSSSSHSWTSTRAHTRASISISRTNASAGLAVSAPALVHGAHSINGFASRPSLNESSAFLTTRA